MDKKLTEFDVNIRKIALERLHAPDPVKTELDKMLFSDTLDYAGLLVLDINFAIRAKIRTTMLLHKTDPDILQKLDATDFYEMGKLYQSMRLTNYTEDEMWQAIIKFYLDQKFQQRKETKS